MAKRNPSFIPGKVQPKASPNVAPPKPEEPSSQTQMSGLPHVIPSDPVAPPVPPTTPTPPAGIPLQPSLQDVPLDPGKSLPTDSDETLEPQHEQPAPPDGADPPAAE